MKGIKLIILSMLFVIFSGCMRNVTTQRQFEPVTTTVPIVETESSTEQFDYSIVEKADIQSEYTYSLVDINVPECAVLNNYCVYDNLVFYSCNYLDYVYQSGENIAADAYRSQICVYDTETDTTEIIYTVLDGTEYITQMDCNGQYLMFVQDVYMGQTPNPQVFLMDLSQDVIQATSVVADIPNTSIVLIEDFIIWKAQGSDLQSESIYRCDYTTGETVELINNISANSFHINNIEKIISICNAEPDNSTNIMAYDFNGKLISNYVVDGNIIDGECNSKGAVWSQNYRTFFYDFEEKEVMSLDYTNSYEFINDVIVSVNSDGIFSCKFGENFQKCILKTEMDYSADFNNINGIIYGKWHVPGQYGMPWEENVITILQITIEDTTN